MIYFFSNGGADMKKMVGKNKKRSEESAYEFIERLYDEGLAKVLERLARKPKPTRISQLRGLQLYPPGYVT